MSKTAAAHTTFRMRTSANGILQGSTACETGYADTSSRPDSIAELSRQWIFEEGYFNKSALYVADDVERASY